MMMMMMKHRSCKHTQKKRGVLPPALKEARIPGIMDRKIQLTKMLYRPTITFKTQVSHI